MTRRRKERWEAIPENLRGAFAVWSRCDRNRIEVGLAVQTGRLPRIESYRSIARRLGIDDKTAAAWAREWAWWGAVLADPDLLLGQVCTENPDTVGNCVPHS